MGAATAKVDAMRNLALALAALGVIAAAVGGQAVLANDEPDVETIVVEVEDSFVVKAERK